MHVSVVRRIDCVDPYYDFHHGLLGKGYHRLHVLCGESLCSHLASWLKVGTTALIVALADAGLCASTGRALRMPLKAFRTFAADPTCSA